jgi:Caspase domain
MVVICIVLGPMLPIGQAAAETRVALIIGNSNYQRADLRLANPANDAAAMAKALKAAGFDTVVQLNASRTDFYKALNQFSDKISRDPHAIGLFYYAGHAVQADGINWLIPVDANIVSQADLEPNAFDAARVMKSMSAAQNEMNIVILDACRNNPLPKTRGMDRGLARIEAPSGTFIAFAAAPGQTAQDGAAGTNGVFTGEFIKAMAEPGLPLELLFKKVIAGVRSDTKGEQTPWSESSIQGDFAFIPKNATDATVANAKTAAVAATPNAPARHVDNANEVEQSYWDRIKDSHDPADFKDYKAQYPNGAHVAEANLLIRKLSSATVAANTAPNSGGGSAAPPSSAPSAPPPATRSVAAHPLVDPAALGHWTMKIPSAKGISTCYWDLKADGAYSAWCVGAQPGAHSGTASVADGRWSLNATTMSWVDGGTYQFPNPDTFIVTGRLGTGAWLRVK